MTHLNLKYNPVAENAIEYYPQIRDNVPLIEELDDEVVDADFFESKMAVQKQQKTVADFVSL